MPILLNADLFELVRVVSVPQAKTAGIRQRTNPGTVYVPGDRIFSAV